MNQTRFLFLFILQIFVLYLKSYLGLESSAAWKQEGRPGLGARGVAAVSPWGLNLMELSVRSGQ